PEATTRRRGQLFSLPAQRQLEIVVLQPKTFDDARAAADYLKMRRSVVVNLRGTHTDLARRIVDFSSGVTYALDGHMLRVAEAIRSMKIRGAPAIGAAAAYGLVLAVQTAAGIAPPALRAHLDAAARMLLGTRPTAVNLRWAVERMLAVPDQVPWHSGTDLAAALLAEAH